MMRGSAMASDAVVGIVRGRWSQAVPAALLGACADVGVDAVELVADELRVVLDDAGPPRVPGAEGVTHLAPAVVHRQPWAQLAMAALERRGVVALNPAAAAAVADDKAATGVVLAAAGVAQVPTIVTSDELGQVAGAAELIGYPVVAKRTHGAQGRWVRLVRSHAELSAALADLAADGPSALVLQPFVTSAADGSGSHGARTIRAIVTGGRVVAATERAAHPDDFRTNVYLGGRQHAVGLTRVQSAMAAASAAALGLGHAGVDLIETGDGPAILEVNACPDFTSMRAHSGTDIAAEVVEQLLRSGK